MLKSEPPPCKDEGNRRNFAPVATRACEGICSDTNTGTEVARRACDDHARDANLHVSVPRRLRACEGQVCNMLHKSRVPRRVRACEVASRPWTQPMSVAVTQVP